MTDHEREVFGEHYARFERMVKEGTLVMAGPTLGETNTGIAVIEAPDRASAERLMNDDPVIVAGIATGELREFRVSLLRGRD
jgi:uncharacterized protein YciI